MLGGEYQVGLVSDLAPKPSLGQSALAAFSKPFEQVNQLHDYLAPGLSTEESRRQSADRLSVMNEILNDPRQGFGQQALNQVSSIAGTIIPTLPLALGGSVIGAGVAGAVGFGAREAAFELGTEGALTALFGTQVPLASLAENAAIRHYLPEVSAAAIGASLTEAYGAYKGFTIPEHFAEHYDAINNALDTNHAIDDWAADNYGFLLGAAPLAAGYIAFKGVRGVVKHRNALADAKIESARLHREHAETIKANEVKEGETKAREAQVSELQDHLLQAEEMGFISPEMHQWYLDYLENPNDPKVHEAGLEILKQLQIPYDRVTGRVWNQVLSREGVSNLQGGLYDEAITNFSKEEQQLLSSYIIHNELDGYIGNMRDNPNLLQAMNGMLESHSIKVAQHMEAISKFDRALQDKQAKGLKKRELFSQDSIYNHLKKIGVYDKSQVPYEVPRSVLNKLAMERQLKTILGRDTLEAQHLFEQGAHLEIKEELKNFKLLSPEDELTELKSKLFPKDKLINNFKNKQTYYRLEELSQVWPQAKVLLDRINMEAINAKQQGLNEILKKFTEMVDVNSSRLADPSLVKRYINSRIEKSVPVARGFEQLKVEPERAATEIRSPEVMYDEQSMQSVDESGLEFARDSFKESEKKFKQFSENEVALNDLVDCALGG